MSRSLVAVVVSWLVVVAIGSTLVWAVISRVGDGLVTAAESSLTPSTTSPTPSALPTRATSPTTSPTAPPTTPPASSPSSSPSSTTPSTPSSPPSSPPSPAGPEPLRATWQGLGGTVVAECTGGAIRQASVQPDPGFRVEVGNPGPEELEVEFEGREDEEGNHSQVRAVCVAGAPRFSVEIDD